MRGGGGEEGWVQETQKDENSFCLTVSLLEMVSPWCLG